MKVAPHPQEVRDLVRETFQSLGIAADQASAIDDVILIRDGHYYGRSYRAAGLMAMWLVEVGILQFYGADGSMLRTVNLFEEVHVERRAA